MLHKNIFLFFFFSSLSALNSSFESFLNCDKCSNKAREIYGGSKQLKVDLIHEQYRQDENRIAGRSEGKDVYYARTYYVRGVWNYN